MAILRCMVSAFLVMGFSVLVFTEGATDSCECDEERLTVRCSSLHKTEFSVEDVSCGSQLRDVDFSNNSLDEFPQSIREFKVVNMSQNSLSRLVSQDVQKVEKLDLSMNAIQQIDLGNTFPNLLILNVSKNHLGYEFDDFLSGNCDLMYLDISENMVSSFESITRCEKLIFLIASKNNLKILPPELLTFKELELLDVSSNSLKHISNLPKSLKMLNLKQNSISVLSTESFGNLTLLKMLNLDSNAIKEIKIDTFTSLISLEVLDLTRNKLKSISVGMFKGMRILKSLILSKNDVESIEEDSFSHLSDLRQLVLDENVLPNIPALRLGKNVHRVSLLLNLIEEMDVAALMTLFSGTESPRKVVLALNKLRGDDPGWKGVLSLFDWRCGDEGFTPLVQSYLELSALSPRYESHKVASSDCACAVFMKNLWNVGVCISDVPTINGQHWLREYHALANREESITREEL